VPVPAPPREPTSGPAIPSPQGMTERLAHASRWAHLPAGGVQLHEEIAHSGCLDRSGNHLQTTRGRQHERKSRLAEPPPTTWRRVPAVPYSVALPQRTTDGERHAVEDAAHKLSVALGTGSPLPLQAARIRPGMSPGTAKSGSAVSTSERKGVQASTSGKRSTSRAGRPAEPSSAHIPGASSAHHVLQEPHCAAVAQLVRKICSPAGF